MKTLKFSIITLIFSLLLFSFACNKESGSNSLLVGTWNTASSVLEITVDGVDYVDYMVNELGFSQQEAQAILELFQDGGPTKIIFREDGTYTTYFADDDPESGTWRLSSDEKTLTIIPEGDDEMAIEIITLTSATLEVILSQEEMDDANDDGVDELIIYTQTMHFTR